MGYIAYTMTQYTSDVLKVVRRVNNSKTTTKPLPRAIEIRLNLLQLGIHIINSYSAIVYNTYSMTDRVYFRGGGGAGGLLPAPMKAFAPPSGIG